MTSNTVTFTSADGTVRYTVLKEWTLKHPSYLEETPYKLNVEYDIERFLHNEHGPAIVTTANGAEYYFNKGVRILDNEQIRRMTHNAIFKDEMDKILGD